MENQTKLRSQHLSLIVIYWAYTSVHLPFIIYYMNIKKIVLDGSLIPIGIFFSFLLISILLTISYCTSWEILLYICFIFSIIIELLFIGLLIFYLLPIFNNFDTIRILFINITIILLLFIFENIPYFGLFIHIYEKLKNKRKSNIENINNNSLVLLNNIS